MSQAIVTTVTPNADWSNVVSESQRVNGGCTQNVFSTLQTICAENPAMRVLFVVCRRMFVDFLGSKIQEANLESTEIRISHVDSLYKLEGNSGVVPEYDVIVLFDWIAGHRCMLSLPNRNQTYRILEALVFKSKKIIKTY
jgi:hypothetical protein